MIEIKNIDGILIKAVDLDSNARSYDEIMALCYRSLSWIDDQVYKIPAGSYIEIDGEIYRLLEDYEPEYNNEASYTYAPKFYDKIALWSKKPLFLITDSSMETDWEDTAYPGQFMEIVVRAIKEFVGETYTYSVDASIAQEKMEYISFQNVSIFDGLNTIADKFGTEWWIEGNVIHLSKCQYGSPVILEVGKNIGLPSVTYNKDGYYTRFYAFGSTRNITQDYDGGNLTNSIVNKRLTLNQQQYPGGYIDIREGLRNEEIFIKSIIFDDIYPQSRLVISSVRGDLKDYLDEAGNKIQVGETDGEPVYKQYTRWYFKIDNFEFDDSTYDAETNPNGMKLPGLNLSVAFQSGQLNGRDFELTYNSENKEYEINFIEENGIITPGSVSLIPADGDEIVLYNIRMPQEYVESAQQELAEALIEEINAKYETNRNTYTFDSYPVDFYESDIDLKVGMAITFRSNDGELSTRVMKVEKNLSFVHEQSITIGNEKIKKSSQEIKEEIVDAKQNIDIVKELADLSKAITDGYGRVQQLIIESMMQYRGLWILNQNGHPEDPSYWTIETDYSAISKKDIVAYSTEESIPDAELPLAGYGISNRGLAAYKSGGGILLDSNGLAYIDPSYAGGGGGLDLDQLEDYLTGNNYLQKNDPVSSLLMTGYTKYSTNSAIQATDNAMLAISKLERKFDFYVTLDTIQIITGSKTFTQDIIGQGDIICYSTSEAIQDAELPIATASTLGLVKAGPGVSIAADGTISTTGGGGLTEVYWSDIKSKPTTLAGYGIPASDLITTLKTVDGSGSGLDADLLDGVHNGSLTAKKINICVPEINSFDDLSEIALYSYLPTSINTPNPYGVVLQLSNNNNPVAGTNSHWLTQIAYGTNGRVYHRQIINTGAWTSWKEFAFTESNVASASKLSPGCNIWGRPLTGESDVSGNMTGVGDITMSGNITASGDYFNIYKSGTFIFHNGSTGGTYICSLNNEMFLGFRGTTKLSFYGGANTINGVGSKLGEWTTDGLCVGGSSHDAKLHVAGDIIADSVYLNNNEAYYIKDTRGNNIELIQLDTSNNFVIGDGVGISNYNTYLSGKNVYIRSRNRSRTITSITISENSGYIGINKTSPSYWLDVNGESYFSKNIYILGPEGGVIETSHYQNNTITNTGITLAAIRHAIKFNWYTDEWHIGALRGDSTKSEGFCVASGDIAYLLVGKSSVKAYTDIISTGDVICQSTSTAISDAELPIATASTLGLIKIGSTLKINNGVVDVVGGSGGGSVVTWGTTSNYVARLTVDGKYKDVSLSGHTHSNYALTSHTHSQYLTSHQKIYTLTLLKNGTRIGTFTPNTGNSNINISIDDSSAGPFNGGTITRPLYINIPNGGETKAFKMRYGTGKYFIINNGGTPVLMANNAVSYNSTANISFDVSKVSAAGFTYTGASDMRLKTKIGDIDGVLDKLSSIKAFYFKYNSDPDGDTRIGVSAQEVCKVFPEVTPLIGGYYQLRYTDFLTAVSVNGIKELYGLQKQTNNEIEVLKQRVALLEAENQNLWNIINEKEAA